TVVIKVLSDDYPSQLAIAGFRREFETGQLAAGRGTVRFLGLEPVRSSWALIMEDGGPSLRQQLAGGRPPVTEALRLGLGLARALGELHRAHLLHKDVNPANVVVHPVTQAVKLVDLGLSSPLLAEQPAPLSPYVLEGTLLYIAPEQTGRT